MAQYKIFANGIKMGIFSAKDENGAFEAYAQDAGYQSVADMEEQLGSDVEYEVVEVSASEQKHREERNLKEYKIFANGANLGVFEAKNEAAALEVYAQEWGYPSFAYMNEQLESDAEYKVVEVSTC